ncbi:hypothetical protein B1748_05125 [Paenibacillus sp. MY03]|jgi:3-hydroxyethyl bacteriochlorophyllide a dehydrogenase|uniref:alcohol dehydrogenase catalytic domain-containing protein n=1 Tax=Paenibacillus sp. MY03 TaxID=302980 RepID=UPI000B3CD5C0|nr:NAD(P)-dependent oxidoreductase [Paenibacillus sp. MY03]OUS78143.1 hypothetical protein B1748_05125 [Paenibacillus sp. MY03]
MKAMAVVYEAERTIAFREVQVPEPKEDEIAVDVLHSWISIGTEKSILFGERIQHYPIVPGYQKVGVVRSIGSAVRNFRIGDPVFVSYSAVQGLGSGWAGHVSVAVVQANMVFRLPVQHPPVRYSPLVVAQVGYNSASRVPINTGDRVLVIGDGLVAHWTAQSLLQRGAEVTVAGRHSSKLERLPQRVNKLLLSQKAELTQAIDQDELHAVVDTVGSVQLISELLPRMRRDSHWVNTGFIGHNYMLDLRLLVEKEITLHMPNGRTQSRMKATFDEIVAGHLQTESLITHRFPAEKVREAWEMILDKSQCCLGVVLDWR